MKRQILKLINQILKKHFSYNFIHRDLTLDSYFDVWKIIKNIGMEPDLIIDVGAARGNWTLDMLNLYPESKYLMFDPLQENELALKRISESYPKVKYHCCALGEIQGELEFNVHSNQSSKYSSEWGGQKRIVPLKTLDSFFTTESDKNNVYLKMDVQGSELDVLAGAEKIINYCKIVQAEVFFRKVYDGAPVAHEIIKYFAEKGFRIFNIVDAIKRHKDGALLQADIFFVSDDILFKSEKWE